MEEIAWPSDHPGDPWDPTPPNVQRILATKILRSHEYRTAARKQSSTMEVPKENIYTSPPFEFVIVKRSFYVHRALVSLHSPPLNRMISGHLREAREGKAVLDDVTEETFTRFVTWLYTGNYTTPNPSHDDLEKAKADETARVDPDDDWSFPIGSSARKKKKKKETTLQNALKEKFIEWDNSPLHGEAIETAQNIDDARTNLHPYEDYTDVFLAHAELHVFAEKYDIQALKSLTLRKLRHTLAVFTMYPDRVDDIITLLEYVYCATAPGKKDEQDIRKTVMFYVTTEMPTFADHGAFKELLAADQDMLSDFLAVFAQKLSVRQP